MKKNFIIFLVMLITIPVMVLAQENVYYTNEKGATLTE